MALSFARREMMQSRAWMNKEGKRALNVVTFAAKKWPQETQLSIRFWRFERICIWQTSTLLQFTPSWRNDGDYINCVCVYLLLVKVLNILSETFIQKNRWEILVEWEIISISFMVLSIVSIGRENFARIAGVEQWGSLNQQLQWAFPFGNFLGRKTIDGIERNIKQTFSLSSTEEFLLWSIVFLRSTFLSRH